MKIIYSSTKFSLFVSTYAPAVSCRRRVSTAKQWTNLIYFCSLKILRRIRRSTKRFYAKNFNYLNSLFLRIHPTRMWSVTVTRVQRPLRYLIHRCISSNDFLNCRFVKKNNKIFKTQTNRTIFNMISIRTYICSREN